MKVVASIVGAIVVVLGISWVTMGNDFLLYRYFAPKQEAVRRQVFEETKSYNQGVIQELQNMQFEIERTQDPKVRAKIGSIMLHRAADYDIDKLPADLRDFISDLKKGNN